MAKTDQRLQGGGAGAPLRPGGAVPSRPGGSTGGGGIVVGPPVDGGGGVPPSGDDLTNPPQGPPVVGGGDTPPAPPRERPPQGIFTLTGTPDGTVAYVYSKGGGDAVAGVVAVENAVNLAGKVIPLLPASTSPSPRATSKAAGNSVALASEPDWIQGVLGSLERLEAGQGRIEEHLVVVQGQAPPTPVAVKGFEAFWSVLVRAKEDEWPELVGEWPEFAGGPALPEDTVFDMRYGWVSTSGAVANQVLAPLTLSDAGSPIMLGVRAWLGINLLGRSVVPVPELIYRRQVVRMILAGDLPQFIESIPDGGEKDRVLWGVLEGEIDLAEAFGLRVYSEVQKIFPAIPDGMGKLKSWEEYVANILRRMGTPGQGGSAGLGG